MPGRDEHASGHWLDGPQRRLGGTALALAAIARALEADSDRLSLWIPVLFGGGILVYFALPEEPRLLTAAALIMAAVGLILAGRGMGLGLFMGGAALNRLGATGYATARARGSKARASRHGICAPGRPSIISARSSLPRIRASLPGERGEIAAALITGERAGISEEDNQAMRNSGLFHILSISGLHMVIMAGTVFWLIRAGLALIPSIALRYPIRKWAAAPRLPPPCSICSCPAPPCPLSVPGS